MFGTNYENRNGTASGQAALVLTILAAQSTRVPSGSTHLPIKTSTLAIVAPKHSRQRHIPSTFEADDGVRYTRGVPRRY